MTIKKRLPIFLLCLGTLFLTGCWDSVELNNRAVLLEFAVDKSPSTEDNYQFIYVIPDYGKLSGTQSLATDHEANMVIEAPNISASIDDLGMKSKDSISFSHVKALFVGEELLKDPIMFKRLIDGMLRGRIIAKNVPVLATNGPVESITKIENTQQPILGLYILDYFKNKERPTSYTQKQVFGSFIREMETTGISTLPIFRVDTLEEEPPKEDKPKEDTQEASKPEEDTQEKAPTEIEISGGALIKDYALVDYLTKEEVRSMLFIKGEIKKSPVIIDYKDDVLSYIIKEQTSKIKFETTDEGMVCRIKIKTKGSINEYLNEEGVFTNPGAIKQIEEDLGEAIKNQVQIGINRSKALNIDYMHLGVALYRKHPNQWKQYKDTWEETSYKALPIQIEVDVTVESTGMQQ